MASILSLKRGPNRFLPCCFLGAAVSNCSSRHSLSDGIYGVIWLPSPGRRLLVPLSIGLRVPSVSHTRQLPLWGCTPSELHYRDGASYPQVVVTAIFFVARYTLELIASRCHHFHDRYHRKASLIRYLYAHMHEQQYRSSLIASCIQQYTAPDKLGNNLYWQGKTFIDCLT
jgi:hypothetical protein